jgi:hypothetical protein
MHIKSNQLHHISIITILEDPLTLIIGSISYITALDYSHFYYDVVWCLLIR